MLTVLLFAEIEVSKMVAVGKSYSNSHVILGPSHHILDLKGNRFERATIIIIIIIIIIV